MAGPAKIKTRIDARYFFIFILVASVILVFFMILPFLTAILSSIILTYIFYPVYKKINGLIKRKNISALISSIVVVLVITLPLFLTLNAVSKQAINAYSLSKDKIVTGNLFGTECVEDNFVCKISNYVKPFLSDPNVKSQLSGSIKKVTDAVVSSVSGLVLSIPGMILNLFIMLFMTFYLFRDGESIVVRIRKVLPLKGAHQIKIMRKFDDMIYAVIFGQILVGIAQGVLGGIGFFIFGVTSPILWGVIMVFASFIPHFGTALVWFPAALLVIANGYLESNSAVLINGILLMLYGTIIISGIDNLLKPKIIGDRGGLHPILALLGVLGGLKIFGFIGIVVGPIILALVVTFVNIYAEER